MALASFFLDQNIPTALIKLTLLVCLIPATVWLYNIYLHPLAKFPGPLLWRASRIPYLRAVWNGHFPYDVKKLHEEYGDVVRVAPNELSFANPAAWDDIYANRAGANSHAFPKSELWHGNPGGGAASVHFITDPEEHSRARRFLGPAFSEKAVLQQEPIIQEYVNLLIDKMRERLLPSGKATINIVDWLNFTLFDIIGDLAYGESFGCLEKCEYEDWMSMTSAAVKVSYFAIHLRHYPTWIKSILGPVLGLSIPKEIIDQRMAYRKRTIAKMNRRLSAKSSIERPDMVSQLLLSEDGKEGLTKDEVTLNSMLFINAASETTATTLVGAINYLLQNPQSLSELQRELRSFSTSSELTLHALKQLPYLDAVLHEALRMCNPNPIGHMRVTPPSGGEVAGQYVPGNTLLTVQPLAMSFSEELFNNPNAWRPERWLPQAKSDTKSPYNRDDRKAVRAFGCGPYNCIGEPLGWAWMRLILAKLVYTFDLTTAGTPNGKLDWDKQTVYATVVKEPLDVGFTSRNS